MGRPRHHMVVDFARFPNPSSLQIERQLRRTRRASLRLGHQPLPQLGHYPQNLWGPTIGDGGINITEHLSAQSLGNWHTWRRAPSS